MKSEHTPGPWLQKGFDLVGSNGERVVCAANGLAFGSAYSFPSAKANARLIAAAPDLLETLLEIKSKAGQPEDVYIIARAAIAKATGHTA